MVEMDLNGKIHNIFICKENIQDFLMNKMGRKHAVKESDNFTCAPCPPPTSLGLMAGIIGK